MKPADYSSLLSNDYQKSLIILVKKIASIPSPTGFEKNKTNYLQNLVKEYGYPKASVDKAGNLIVPVQSLKNKKTLLLSAHVDTACKVDGNKINITEDNKYIYGHGVCDNSSGIVGLLTFLKLIKKYSLVFPINITAIFTVGEEGMGGKKGMRYFMQKNKKNIDYVINIESHPIGRITHKIKGQFRAELEIDTHSSGHSFRDFGKPNAILIASQSISLLHKIFKKYAKNNPETTYNFGYINGGEGINVIPQKVVFSYEFRTENTQVFNSVKKDVTGVYKKIKRIYSTTTLSQKIISDKQPFALNKDHELILICKNVHKKLGIRSILNSGNADSDIPLSMNIPAVSIGTSNGKNTHSMDEYIEKKSLYIGVKQVFLVVTSELNNL